MISAARACVLAAVVLCALASPSGAHNRGSARLTGAGCVREAIEASQRSLLSASGNHGGSVEETGASIISTTSSPSYGILTELQEYLGFSAAAKDTHKALFPLGRGDIIGYVLTILVLFIAAGGGIGGGGAIIPLYILFLRFNTRIAVALGNITIVGGALSNFVFNVPRRHSVFNRPLIDWDLILVMEPATILGALIGGYLNKLFPNWLTTILLALLLTFISYKLVVRGVISWHKETIEHEHQALEGSDVRQPLLGDEAETRADQDREPQRESSRPIPSGKPNRPHASEAHSPLAYTGSLSHRSLSRRNSEIDRPPISARGGADEETEGESEERSGLGRLDEQEASRGAEGDSGAREAPTTATNRADVTLTVDGEDGPAASAQSKATDDVDTIFAEKRQIPPIRFGILVLLTAVVAASDFLKAIVTCGGWLYWLIVLIIVPVVLLVTFGARNYLLKKRSKKQAAGYVWHEGDVDWNPVTTLTYPAICSVAGLVAGPLMLELGVLPDVASATSATMIVFTSASASIVFLSFGGIPTDYAIACFIIGLVFTMLGQIACYILMRILHRRSVIVFAMAALMLLSMVIVYYEAVVGTRAAVRSRDGLWHFGHLCGSAA